MQYDLIDNDTTTGDKTLIDAIGVQAEATLTTVGADVGTYKSSDDAITVSYLSFTKNNKAVSATNFSIKYDAELSITKQSLTVKKTATKQYDGTVLEASLVPSDFVGIVSGDELTGKLTSSGSVVGDYTMDQTPAGIVASDVAAQGSTVAGNYDLQNINYDACKLSITQKIISDEDIANGDLVITYTDAYTYDGAEHNPTNESNFAVKYKDTTLVKDTDFAVNSTSQTEANSTGTNYIFAISGTGNYKTSTAISCK